MEKVEADRLAKEAADADNLATADAARRVQGIPEIKTFPGGMSECSGLSMDGS